MSSSKSNNMSASDKFPANMLIVNMSTFIAWGVMAALFMPGGWAPDGTLGRLVDPMIIWLLPLLVGYSSGRLTGGESGGIVGATIAMGLIAGTNIPMFSGAMIAGPLSGKIIRYVECRFDGRPCNGFNRSVDYFSVGITGILLAVLAFMAIGPLIELLSQLCVASVQMIMHHHLLPLIAIVIEPAKVLFLNPVIHQDILSPLGTQQAVQTGRSIFFLVENPGPGLGVLMACMLSGKGHVRQFAASAAVIHFFGGIPAIYFPYVLIKPRLILALILGGITGIVTLILLKGGLVAPASPDSILAILARTPAGSYFANLTAVVAACILSFISSVILLNIRIKTDNGAQEVTTLPGQDIQAHFSDDAASQMGERHDITQDAEYNSLAQQVSMISEGTGDGLLSEFQLRADTIFLNQQADTKEQAILFVGRQLVNKGYVEQEYVNAMLIREKMASGWQGNFIALLQGPADAQDRILHTGMVFCQYPQGVYFGNANELAYVVIGIAARDESVQIINYLTHVLHEPSVIARLTHTESVQEVLDILVELT